MTWTEECVVETSSLCRLLYTRALVVCLVWWSRHTAALSVLFKYKQEFDYHACCVNKAEI